MESLSWFATQTRLRTLRSCETFADRGEPNLTACAPFMYRTNPAGIPRRVCCSSNTSVLHISTRGPFSRPKLAVKVLSERDLDLERLLAGAPQPHSG